MPGYDDPRFASKGSVAADPYDLDHLTPDPYPPDPAPQNGQLRVLYRGQWMTWERYIHTRSCGDPNARPPERQIMPWEVQNRKRRKPAHGGDQAILDGVNSGLSTDDPTPKRPTGRRKKASPET